MLQGRQLQDARVFQKQQNISLALSDLATDFIQKGVNYRRNNLFRSIGLGFIPIILLTVFLGFIGYREVRISHLRDVVKQAQGKKVDNARFNALEELVKLDASLKRVNLAGTNLGGANLGGANLKGANLQDADLSGAKFWNKELGEEAKDIPPSQIKQAKNWEKAVYSPEFRKKLGLPPKK